MSETDHQIPATINPCNFPAKLWRLVNNPANSAICWGNSGETIIIDQLLFEQNVLSPVSTYKEDTFKTTRFSSFVRQLNLYGFRKVDPSSSAINSNGDIIVTPVRKKIIHHFYNQDFIRSNPARLANLKRLTVDNKDKMVKGQEVRSRPPSKYQLSAFTDENGLTKNSCSFGGGHKDSPHPYRKLPMAIPCGTPFYRPPVGHPYAPQLSTPLQPGARCGVNYGSPDFTRIQPQNRQYHPGFYPPAVVAVPHGLERSYMPIGFFQARYPLMDGGAEGQRANSLNNIKQVIKKEDVNLDTVFQIADEVMLTQPNKLIKIEAPDNAVTSYEPAMAFDPKPTPREALNKDTREELDKTEMIEVEVSNTSGNESFQG